MQVKDLRLELSWMHWPSPFKNKYDIIVPWFFMPIWSLDTNAQSQIDGNESTQVSRLPMGK